MMDKARKLELARKLKQAKELENLSTEQRQSQREKAFLDALSGLSEELAKGVDIRGTESVEKWIETIEEHTEATAKFIEMLAKSSADISSLSIPKSITLKEVANEETIEALRRADVTEVAQKLDSLNDIVARIGDTIRATQENQGKQSQRVQDYLPVRIVVGEDNDLSWLKRFAAEVYVSGGGGGGTTGGLTDSELRASPVPVSIPDGVPIDTTGLATETGQSAIVDAIEAIPETDTSGLATEAKQDDINTKLDTLNAAQKIDWGFNDKDETTDPLYVFFGFEAPDGKWKLVRKTVATGAFRYATGASDYATAWSARTSQTYASYGTTF